MTVQDPRSIDIQGILARVRAILLSPATTWDQIAAEPATLRSLYVGYVLVLAAVGPVANMIGALVFGYNMGPVSFHPSVSAALEQAIVFYLLSLALVFLMGLVIDAVAPSFGGQKSQIQAMKLATYSMTPFWVTGALALVPALRSVVLLGILYGIWLVFLGLPRVMRAPSEKVMGYAATVTAATVVMWLVAGAITMPMVGADMIAASVRGSDHVAGGKGGSIDINGEHIDLDKLQSATNQLGDLAKRFEQGVNNPNAAPAPGVNPVSTEALKALLPDSLPGGYQRTERGSGGAFGTIVQADASYAKDGKVIKLSVLDLSTAGAFAQLAAAFGIESETETADGFEKVGKVNGVLTVQEWHRGAGSGKYSVLLADRFIIDAEGQAGSFDDLKGAVAAVGPDRVLRLK